MSPAVIFDVGGVLLVPDVGVVGEVLRTAQVEVDDARLAAAHHHAIWHLDDETTDLVDHSYDVGYLTYLGLAGRELDRAMRALDELGTIPAIEVWTSRVAGAGETLRAVVDAGVPVAIVSNSDGTVEESLRRRGLCQVGPGPLPSVAAVIDSAVLGVAKPDPGIFVPALEATGCAASETWYVGDSERFDVASSRAAGMRPIHFDPFGLCRHPTAHRHLSQLFELRSLLDE